jgi:hypothetical protein
MALRVVLVGIGVVLALLLVVFSQVGAALGSISFTVQPPLTAPSTVASITPGANTSSQPPLTTEPGLTTIITSAAPLTTLPATGSTVPVTLTYSSGPSSGVTFKIEITSVAFSGLNVNVGVRLTNSGSVDANNVQAKVELFSGSVRVKINGQDFIQENLGTLSAGQSLDQQENLSISATDAVALLMGGGNVTIKLTISSDEGTQQISQNYHP